MGDVLYFSHEDSIECKIAHSKKKKGQLNSPIKVIHFLLSSRVKDAKLVIAMATFFQQRQHLSKRKKTKQIQAAADLITHLMGVSPMVTM